MNIRVQAVNFNARPDLYAFVKGKYVRLNNYFDKITGIEVYLKVKNTTDKQNKVVETKVSMPGNEIVVKKDCSTFEEGTDRSLDALKRQIQRYKERLRDQ